MSVDADRDVFRAGVAEADRLTREGDSKAANKVTANLETLLKQYTKRQELVSFLSPLLDEAETDSVRFNAATGLLGAGYTDLAVPVLEAVSQGKSRSAISARLVLQHWRRQHA